MEGFTWFDLAVVGLMLVSGLLALARGFTREITSLVAWGAAAIAAFVAVKTPELITQAKVYVKDDLVAQIAVGAIAFLVVLIILSVISIRFTDWLLDSAPGAFDRTLGFFYGLARGLALVVIAYLFYIWLQPEANRFDAVRTARTLQPVESAAIGLVGILEGFPMTTELANDLRSKTYRFSREKTIPNPVTPQPGAVNPTKDKGYKNGQKKVLDQLIENTQKPAN